MVHLASRDRPQRGQCFFVASGRALPTDIDVASIPPKRDTFSFYGRVSDEPGWGEGVRQFVSKLHHSTTKSCGILVGGHMTHAQIICRYYGGGGHEQSALSKRAFQYSSYSEPE